MTTSEIQAQRFETLKAVLHYFYRDNTRSGSHSRHNIKYHFVWIPKYRREVLVGKIPARLKEILEEIAQSYKLKIVAQEVMPDHIHVLVEAPPTHSPTKIVQVLKGISSKKLREEFLPQLKKHIWKDGVLWATGYYVASVSDGVTSDVVKEYIETQHQRPYKVPVNLKNNQP
ncbi:MAG: IS200/IS605 family transposase [Patescibacteria group bacterium]